MRFCFKDRFLEMGGTPLVMGILNVTPDSFSDGGECVECDAALSKARKMLDEGAAMIDIGGESTRPGHESVALEEELRRVVPVVGELRRALGDGPVISVDTTKPKVAEEALEAGADIVNDVSALAVGGFDMCAVLKRFRAGCILMHSRPIPAGAEPMQAIAASLEDSLKYALDNTGLPREYFALDPGIGFCKDLKQNLLCCTEYSCLRKLGLPILVGASRKSFLGLVTERPVEQRDYATVAVSFIAAYLGADMLRVHNVAANMDAVKVAMALRGEQ